MSRIRAYSSTLPKCMLLWMWWIWAYCCGLSALNTTLRYACMPSQIKIPYQATALDQLLTTITRTDIDTVDQDHSPMLADIAVTVTIIHTEDVPGHIIETIDIAARVLHDASTPVIIVPTVTPYITDNLHTGAHQLTLGIRADWSHCCSAYKPPKQALHKSSMHSSRPQEGLHHKRYSRVMIDDPQMDFYSSEDNSSDSEDDSDHLN